MKRRKLSFAACRCRHPEQQVPPLQSDLSRFLPCPACGKQVPAATINMHLDLECPGTGAGDRGAEAGGSGWQHPPPGPGQQAAANPQDVRQDAYAAHQQRQPQLQEQPRQQQPKEQQYSAPQQNGLAPPPPASPAPASEAPAGEAGPNTLVVKHMMASAARGGNSSSSSSQCFVLPFHALLVTAYDRRRTRRGLTAEALKAVAHCELLPAFLPDGMAAQVLRELVGDQPSWERMRWWINGVQTESRKTSALYALQNEGGDAFVGTDESVSGPAVTKVAGPALQAAGEAVAAAVTARILGGAAAALPLETSDRQGWAPSYAVANCYADGCEGLGPHSDRLTPLGPCPIIASLSLGATRTFRLRRTQRVQLAAASGGGAAAAAAAGTGGMRAPSPSDGFTTGSAAARPPQARSAGAEVVQVDIALPHNTLLVMWPPVQEAWTHEVPKTAQPVSRHKLSGTARYNLTFRRLKPQWQQRAPACRCGRQAVMKPQAPREPPNEQRPVRVLRYCYACDNSKGPSCRFYTPCSHHVRL